MKFNHFSQLKHKNNLQKAVSMIERQTELWMWKTGLGKIVNCAPDYFGNSLVLIFMGNHQMIPLKYQEISGEIIAVTEKEEDIRNAEVLLSNSAIQVWMKNGWYSGNALVVTGEKRNLLLSSIIIGKMFGHFGSRHVQQNPQKWQVLSIQRNAACTGEKGPGQYSWVWAVSTVFFFFAWLRKKVK